MTQEKQILVKKRNGTTEPLDVEKINKIVAWAVKDLDGVSLSDIEINARINFVDGISTEEIHESIIQSAANLISVKNPLKILFLYPIKLL